MTIDIALFSDRIISLDRLEVPPLARRELLGFKRTRHRQQTRHSAGLSLPARGAPPRFVSPGCGRTVAQTSSGPPDTSRRLGLIHLQKPREPRCACLSLARAPQLGWKQRWNSRPSGHLFIQDEAKDQVR